MALCKDCEIAPGRFCLPGPEGQKCSVCQKELEDSGNEVCPTCSLNKNLCEYCGGTTTQAPMKGEGS